MKAISSLLTLALAALLVAGCTKENDATPSEQLTENGDFYEQNKAKITVTEGIAGTLTLKEGNCMPMIGTGSSTCKQYPVRRVIKVYSYTTIREVINREGAFFTLDKTPLATAESDAEGFYQISLAPGSYSLFVEERGKLYANSSDGYGGLNPVLVESRKVSTLNLVIDYAAY